ncbi:hypothetical protein [Mesorhizobium sp. YM1C-6-2]|uniref:hypothetical protein n=1 Tax=Mesorhizobium sp. YM1C-6-2 TaxID=1827501 RepID=UPI000EF17D18|nr:hypothetical protein [Mesorhizobium sp. YM1C-6-2]RLP22252.1 hypothetical protein D8676_25265 [Mesorhizobium sp. YM1C-6-2]
MFLMLTDRRGKEFAVNTDNIVKMEEFENGARDEIYTVIYTTVPSGDAVFVAHSNDRLHRIMQMIDERGGS